MGHAPVDHVVGVEISQALQRPVGDGGDLHLLQRFFVHWEGDRKGEGGIRGAPHGAAP